MKTSFATLLALTLGACTTETDAPAAVDTATDTSAETSADTSPPPELAMNMLAEGRLNGSFLSIWSSRKGTVADPEPVWFVGGTLSTSSVVRYAKGAWETVDTGLQRRLWWVHGFSDDDVFAVGEVGAATHWDGKTWTSIPTGIDGTTLYGVWGATPDDVWAVGGPRLGSGGVPERYALVHWDGKTWTRLTIPVLEAKAKSEEIDLFKIWGSSKDNMIIVGATGLALHWDGTEWRQEPTGVDDGGTLFTVTGRAANDAWAIGGFNASSVIHWDGSVWTRVPSGEFAPGLTQGIFTAPGLDSVYTGGLEGYVSRLDGSTWTESDVLSNYGFHAVWVDGGGRLWAAGGDIMTGNPELGAIATDDTTVPLLE